jgi:hypothetical protein
MLTKLTTNTMAISHEDYKDVKNAYGKALAKKVKKATNDGPKMSQHFADLPPKARARRLKDGTMAGDPSRIGRGMREFAEGKYVRMKPTQSTKSRNSTNVTAFSPYRPGDEDYDKFKVESRKGLKLSPERYNNTKPNRFKGTFE